MIASLRSYPIPANDAARSRVVDAMGVAERQGDPFFAHVTEVAKQLFGTPIAFLSLMGDDTQNMLHCNGADVPGTPREMSLCAFTVAARKAIILHDTHLDLRSVNHPVVTGGFRLRFSASAPVILSSGFCIGTLCAVDFVPHEPATVEQVSTLESLAAMTARFYEVPAEPDYARAADLRRIVDEAQTEFLSLVSHELRTPLNGIYGMAQLLEAPDDDTAEMVSAITESAKLLNGIVESILRFTELRSGSIDLCEEPLDVAEILRGAIRSHDKMMRMRGKICDASGIASALPMTGDRAKLALAFSCLIANVLAHGGCNASVEARRLEDGSLVIMLADDGEGISPAREARIWEAFGTGTDVQRRGSDGIGLGLPLTRRIVELHGGELDLIQTHPGMIVHVRLPAWRGMTP